MSESAIDWIERHKEEYDVTAETPYDCSNVWFAVSLEDTAAWATVENARAGDVCIRLETAEDCEALCRLLRITPERK